MISHSIRVPLQLHPADELPRTPGVHLSGILKAMGTKAGWLKKRENEEDLGLLSRTCDPYMVGESALLMRAILGHAWEAWVKKAGLSWYFPGFITPKELACDGIWMTPDGLSFAPQELHHLIEPGEFVLHEGKATWKYAKEPVADSRLWMYQACGYLKGLSVLHGEPITKVIFHPAYVRRDGGIDPIYLPQLIVFEQEEIDMAWGHILANKHLADPEVDYNAEMVDGWIREAGRLTKENE